MKTHTKFYLSLLITTAGIVPVKAMEPTQHVMKTADGHSATITDKIIKLVVDSSSLEQACKDIRSLAHTNKELQNFLNSRYNTLILIKELAAAYTNNNPIVAMEALKTREAAKILLHNTHLLRPSELVPANPNSDSYFSLLPQDIFRNVINLKMAELSYDELIKFFTNKPKLIKDNFRLIYFVAQKHELFKSDNYASLICTARLLDTPGSRWWLAQINPTKIDSFKADIHVANHFLSQKQYNKAQDLLKGAAEQKLDFSLQAEANLALAKLFTQLQKDKKTFDSELVINIRHYALKAAYQSYNRAVRNEAIRLCYYHRISTSPTTGVI